MPLLLPLHLDLHLLRPRVRRAQPLAIKRVDEPISQFYLCQLYLPPTNFPTSSEEDEGYGMV